jgi:hypothetical protein
MARMRRLHLLPLLLLPALAGNVSCAHAPKNGTVPDPTSATFTVHQELDNAHARDAQAFYRMSIDEVMALRTADFQWSDASSGTRSELETEAWLGRLFSRITEIENMESSIEGLALDGDQARAMVRQRMTRLQRLPNDDSSREKSSRGFEFHHVEIWTTQRETWVRSDNGWKLKKVEVTGTPTVTVDGKSSTLAAVEP